MKNKIKILIYLCLTFVFLVFFTLFITQRIFQYVIYSELFTMYTIQTLGVEKSMPLIEGNIHLSIEKIKQGAPISEIFQGVKDYDIILYMLSFSPKDNICIEFRDDFNRSKNKHIQEYLKNECDK